jgi:hypothetical protein
VPAEVLLNEVPMGVAAGSSRKGETVPVRVTGFLSSEDGQELIGHLEQFPSTVLMKAVGTRVPPSKVDNLLAIVRRDKTATVYVNELQPQLISMVGRPKEKGEPVFMDDIVDITAAELGVEVPADAGVVIVFSWGWRKGLFYDFGPLLPDGRPREFDLSAVLGELYARLLFQQRYRISDDEWAQLFGCGWFPFAGLGNETIRLMLAHLRERWDMDELIPRIAEEVRGKVPSFLQAWLLHPALAPHAPILERAIGHFLSGDHVSCAGLLYPQIEGVLRSHPVGAHAGRAGSLLMPHRFEDYLKEVYLPRFNPAAPPEGQVPTAVSQQKSAAVAILVVHQLFHSFDPPPRERESAVVERSEGPGRRSPDVDAAGAANRWSQWMVTGEDEVLARLIEYLDANLPSGWKRLQGESLNPFGSGVRPGSAWYSIDSTPEHVGVTLSVERARPRGMRGGRVWFAAPPHPPTATIPAAWGQVMTFLDDGIVVAARAAGAQVSAPGTDELFLAELPPEVAGMLVRFSRSARKALPLAADDAHLWHSFVIGAFRARAAVESRRLVEWFVHEGWERNAALELNLRFFEQCRLLSRYAEEVALVS